MAGYGKLFASILTSTIWGEDHVTFRVWMAMIASADGMGVVEGSVPGFAHLCRITVEEMEHSLERLRAPDPYSRSKDFEGRRIEDVDGGWLILNHGKYREKSQAGEGSRAPYMRGYRAKKKAERLAREKEAYRVYREVCPGCQQEPCLCKDLCLDCKRMPCECEELPDAS